MSPARRTSFVVRVARDRHGQVSGVVERVATGAKEPFIGMEAIGRVIARMLGASEDAPDPRSGGPGTGDPP